MVQRGYWIILAFTATAAAQTAVESIAEEATPAEDPTLIRPIRPIRCLDPNSHWTDWEAACENTCARPNNSLTCISDSLEAGCICNEGYLKDENGICQCAKVCVRNSCKDPNSHWSYTEATGCYNTCENPHLSWTCKPSGPRAGCICNSGYLLDANGICQNGECCANCKDPNSHYSSTLANGCDNTCEDPDMRSHCASKTFGAGCICNEPDFVLRFDGTCVRPRECYIRKTEW